MKVHDVRGRRHPLLLGDLTREMRDAPAGHVVEVLADGQSVVDALVAWCRAEQHTLVSIDTIEGDLRVFLRKGNPPPRPRHRVGGTTLALRILG